MYNDDFYEKYYKKIFFNKFICGFLPKIIDFYSENDCNNNFIDNFAFVKDNNSFSFCLNNIRIDIGEKLSYFYFRKFFIEIMQNYGMNIIVNNDVFEKYDSNLINSGKNNEKITISGKISQYLFMYELELKKYQEIGVCKKLNK